QPHERAYSTNAGTVTTTHGLPRRIAGNTRASLFLPHVWRRSRRSPSQWRDRGAFYPVFETRQLSAGWRYTTPRRPEDIPDWTVLDSLPDVRTIAPEPAVEEAQ